MIKKKRNQLIIKRNFIFLFSTNKFFINLIWNICMNSPNDYNINIKYYFFLFFKLINILLILFGMIDMNSLDEKT